MSTALLNNITDDSLTWYPAPAKLNLFLHVIGRRDDGYHRLQTVFRFIDYADELAFVLRDDGKIILETPHHTVPATEDLTVRAARLLQENSGQPHGVSIYLRKRLPLGGGLGGGSSDAATTLLVLNRLWQLNYTRSQLQDLGLRLGADVPVFIFGHNAFAEGVGEQLHALTLPENWYVVLIPAVSVPTAHIFSSHLLTRNTPPLRMHDFPNAHCRNDLEAVAKALYPEVKNAIDLLNQFGNARMTGSGCCVFLECSTKTQAQQILAALPKNIAKFIAQGLNQHPLCEM